MYILKLCYIFIPKEYFPPYHSRFLSSPGNTQQRENQNAQNVLKKYTLSFASTDLHSIRRSDSKFHWHFLVFVLKDGTTLPALHFHSGGTAKFIQHLHRYVWLTK